MWKRALLVLLMSVSFLAAQKIDSVDVKGYGDADKLKAVTGIKVGDTYTADKIVKAKKLIISALESGGYHNNVVESTISDKGGTVGVVFDVNRGDKITITKVNFMGNDNVSASDLEANLINKESEFLGWFPGRSNGTANTAQLKYDGHRVQDEYLKRGYLDVQVSDPLMRVDSSSYKAEISYSIKEGKVYNVSAVSITGDTATGLDKNALREELNLKADKVFNVEKLRKDIKAIKEAVGNLGYAYAKVKPDFYKNATSLTVAIIYRVNLGMRVTIGDVTVKGNEKTKEHVVRRYVYLAPGDLYNYTDYKDSQRALARTGFFETATLKRKKATGNKVDLEVTVKEAKTGAFTAGGGYSSADGFLLNGSVSEKNIFGSGIEGSIAIDYSEVRNSYSLSFRDPRLFDSKYSLSAGIYKKDSDYTDQEEYDNLGYLIKDEIGGYVSLGRQLTRSLYASVGYRYGVVEYGEINATSVGDGIEDYRDYVKSAFIASLVYDSTDDYYTPREGIYAKLNFEYAGLGSAPSDKTLAEFTKTQFKFAMFYGLQDSINYDLIFRYKFRLGYIDAGDGEYIPRAEKLYLGGASRGVRGFSSGSISPYLNNDSSSILIGGHKSMVHSLEASIPLSKAAKMRLTLFADYGTIGINSFDEITKKSVGAQVEWQSPFGPVNLVFAKAIDPETYDKTANFEFSMGTKF